MKLQCISLTHPPNPIIMKKICSFLLFTFCFFQTINAQEDFETHTCTSGICGTGLPGATIPFPNIDDNLCLPNWSVSHGTPAISTVGQINGNNALALEFWNFEIFPDFESEGAYMHLTTNIEQGKCYAISFLTRLNPFDETTLPALTLEVELANGLMHQTDNCNGLPPTVSNSQSVLSLSTDNMIGEFGQIFTHTNIVTADNNYSQLWFYIQPGSPLLTDINGGTLYIDDVIIYEVDCNFPCACPDGLKLGLDGATIPISNYSASAINQTTCIAIAGTLEIDANFSLNGKDFIMQPGAEIRIKNGFNLDLFNCNIKGCLQMWKSITIEDGGSLRMVGTTVEDAQYAVQALDGSSIGIANNKFYDNYIGLFIDGTNTSGTNGQVTLLGASANINSNEFYHINGLIPAYDNQSPLPEERTHAGIFLKNVDNIDIGSTINPFTPNTFFHIKNGILMDHATAEIHNNNIAELGGTEIADFPYDICGYGIYLNNDSEAFIANNDINIFFIGIRADGSDLTVTNNNDISTTIRCIQVTDPLQKNIEISHNQLASENRAILVENADPAEWINIEDNDITMSELGHYTIGSIELTNCNSDEPEAGNYRVLNNDIAVNALNSGIEVFNSSGWLVQGNTIVSGIPNYFTTGIRLFGSSKCQVRQNTMTGVGVQDGCQNSISTLTSRAILVENTGGSLYCCNIMDETTLGMSFKGACGKSNIRRNQFYTHQHGIHYTQGTITNTQLYHGNKWHENCCDLDAFHAGGSTEALLCAHEDYYIHAPFDHAPSSLFTIAPGATEVFCGEQEDCGIPVFGFGPGPVDKMIANGDLPDSFKGTALTWMEQYRLFAHFFENPQLLDTDPVFPAFYHKHEQGEIGQLYHFSNELRRTLSVLPQDKISSKRSLEQLISQNQSIPTTSTWGEKQKHYNDLYVKYWLQDRSLSNRQLQEIESLAMGCPKIDGKVVYQARSLHQVVTQAFKDWEAEEDCEVKSFLEQRQITSIQTSNHLNVYPNPANDHLLLDYSNLEGEILKGRIIDLNGRTIRIFNAASNKPEISVADLPSGLYFLQLETSETYYSTKFSILR